MLYIRMLGVREDHFSETELKKKESEISVALLRKKAVDGIVSEYGGVSKYPYNRVSL